MSSLPRWRPTKGDVNKIKMEVSPTGRYVRYADHLAERERLESENARLLGILRSAEERMAAIAAVGAAGFENTLGEIV